MYLFQISTIRFMAQIIKVPKYILFPVIAVFCAIGVISIRNSMFDLFSIFLFIVIGYVLDKNGYPLSPFILASVLGTTVETNLRRSIMYYNSFAGCLKQVSIGTLFFVMAVGIPVIMAVLELVKKRKSLSKENAS